MDVDIHLVPVPGEGAEPSALLQGRVQAANEHHHDAYGHTDFDDTPESYAAQYAHQAYRAKLCWAAVRAGTDPAGVRPDEVLAGATAHLPLADNRTSADVALVVRPSARGQGIGRRLFDHVAADLAARGRTVWTTASFHPAALPGSPGSLTANSGAGTIDGRHAAASFARNRGFVLEQAERYSILRLLPDVPHWHADLATWRRDAARHAGPDYELLQWVGRTPEEHLVPLAALRARMSVDVPSAGLEIEEEHWDADRVQAHDYGRLAAGERAVTTAVLHRPTGDLAAYTELLWPHHHPTGVWQEDTLVHGDHRGRRLGMLAKAANLTALVEANPAAQRVHTWNAVENTHMLAINQALGFVAQGLEAAWQRRA